jgi:hypothetical protein
MSIVKNKDKIDKKRPILDSTAYIVDIPSIKDSVKHMSFTKGKAFSIAIPVVLGVATMGDATTGGGAGIFWKAFMQYIFPYMMDIAKVFCAIKIAQSFYQERRGGRDEGSGVGAFVSYGKWYLLFAIMPWAVELLDQLGTKMLVELRSGGL